MLIINSPGLLHSREDLRRLQGEAASHERRSGLRGAAGLTRELCTTQRPELKPNVFGSDACSADENFAKYSAGTSSPQLALERSSFVRGTALLLCSSPTTRLTLLPLRHLVLINFPGALLCPANTCAPSQASRLRSSFNSTRPSSRS